MKGEGFLDRVLPHLWVGLITVGAITFFPTALYYAFAIYSGFTQNDFGGPLNFVLIPLIFFVLGTGVALLIAIPISVFGMFDRESKFRSGKWCWLRKILKDSFRA